MTEYFNQYNLGDCIWHCLFMRKMASAYPAESFRLYCKWQYLAQLHPIVSDLPAIELWPLEHKTEAAVPCWIGPHHNNHPLRHDIIGYLVEWFQHLAEQTGHRSPISTRTDLLCDYPQLLCGRVGFSPVMLRDGWLVINSQPMSGQFPWEQELVEQMIERLACNNDVLVVCPCRASAAGAARYVRLDVTDIGWLSNWCSRIIAVANGPVWPTFNVWNQRVFQERLILLNTIRINYGVPLSHFDNITACTDYLHEKGYL